MVEQVIENVRYNIIIRRITPIWYFALMVCDAEVAIIMWHGVLSWAAVFVFTFGVTPWRASRPSDLAA